MSQPNPDEGGAVFRNPVRSREKEANRVQERSGLIIVPAYNEGASLHSVTSALRHHAPDWDIVVIDDGSTDGTVDFTAPGIVVVHLPFNLGIGGAVQAGYLYAHTHGYSRAVQVDGDGQHPPEAIADLEAVQRSTGADMVIGSRFLEPGMYQQSLSRAVGIAIIRSLLRVLTGRRFSDCTSGFRLVNARLIRAFAHWYPDDYPEPEVLLHLHQAGCSIEERGVRMHQRVSGVSSISFGTGVVYVLKVVTSLLLGTLRRPWRGSILKAGVGAGATRGSEAPNTT